MRSVRAPLRRDVARRREPSDFAPEENATRTGSPNTGRAVLSIAALLVFAAAAAPGAAPAATFSSATNHAVGATPWGVAAADLNGDADLDLAVVDSGVFSAGFEGIVQCESFFTLAKDVIRLYAKKAKTRSQVWAA